MKRALFVLLAMITIVLSSCGKPFLGYESGDTVFIRKGSVINPGSYDSCKVTIDTIAVVSSIGTVLHREGSTHQEQTLTVKPLSGSSFPCENGEFKKGYIYGSEVRLHNP